MAICIRRKINQDKLELPMWRRAQLKERVHRKNVMSEPSPEGGAEVALCISRAKVF